MKFLLIASICILAVSAGPKYHELEGYTFAQYCKDFNKPHLLTSKENVQTIEKIFNQNMEEIRAHNNANHSWKKGVNQFTDLTEEQFKKYYLADSLSMGRGFQQQNKRFLEETFQKTGKQLPKRFDWRDQGVITPIKDQGICGSCWAHATTETIESHAAINSGKLITLSPQQLVSCMTNGQHCGGNGGCEGALPQLGYTYAELFSMTTAQEYPYFSGQDGESRECIYNKSTMSSAVSIMGHMTLPYNDQTALEEALVEYGPVSVLVDCAPWMNYESGIFNGCDFEKNISLNHVVQLVGYTEDYFIIRNSFSSTWGEKGYIRLERNKIAKCGLDRNGYTDSNECTNDGESDFIVCGQCGMLTNSVIPLGARVN